MPHIVEVEDDHPLCTERTETQSLHTAVAEFEGRYNLRNASPRVSELSYKEQLALRRFRKERRAGIYIIIDEAYANTEVYQVCSSTYTAGYMVIST